MAAVAFIVLPAAGGTCAGHAAEPGSSFEALVEQVKRAVVVVKAFDARGKLLSQGTGFYVEGKRIVTNLHVVGRASRVEVLNFSGETLSVEGAVAFDEGRDLAILQTGGTGGDVVALSERAAREGEEVIVVSNPAGSFWEVSKGRTLAPWVSAELGRLVPFTARVSRGSSGGPVVNLSGQVVGVATMALRTDVDQFFAVPTEQVAALRLREHKPMPFPLHSLN